MEGQSRSEQECASFVASVPGDDEGSEGRKVKDEGLNGRKVGTGSIWHVSGPLDCERVGVWYRYVCAGTLFCTNHVALASMSVVTRDLIDWRTRLGASKLERS